MKLRYGQVKAGNAPLAQALSAARGARNRATRDARAQAQEDHARDRRHRRRRAKEERELKRALNRKFRVRVPEKERPRSGTGCPRKLFHRLAGLAFGTTGMRPSGDAGTRSIHFAFVARGFASKTGRRWRSGEADRAALYVTRAEGLEGGEAGWWSNIAEDRNELVAYTRVSEEVEKHDRANANVYISEIISLDHTLTARQRRRVVKRICRYLEKRGLGYVAALHTPDSAGDQRNFHCHILYSLRPVQRLAPYEWEFAASKVADINTPDGIQQRRKAVVRALNATLAATGSARRYTHLSNRARGLPPPAAGKVGQAATWLQRRIQRDEDRIARLARVKSALERIRAGLAADRQVDRLGAIAAERLDQHRQHIAVARTQVRSRMSRVIQAICIRLGDMRHTILSSRDLGARLDRIGVTIAADAQRRAAWREKAARIRIALARVPLDGLRESVKRRLATQAENIAATSRGHDNRIATLKSAVSTRLIAVSTAVDADIVARLTRIRQIADLRTRRDHVAAAVARLPDLDCIRTSVRDRLAHHKRIAGAMTPVDDRLVAIADRMAAISTAQAKKMADAPARSGTAAGLAALLPRATVRRRNDSEAVATLRAALAGRTPEPHIQANYRPGRPPTKTRDTPRRLAERDALLRTAARDRTPAVLTRLRKAAFARLAALDNGITLRAGKYQVGEDVLFDDELRALDHPDFAQETSAILRRIWLEQVTRQEKLRRRGEEPNAIGHDQTGRLGDDEPPVIRPGGGWER